jgi:hypothetical protein
MKGSNSHTAISFLIVGVFLCEEIKKGAGMQQAKARGY